MRAMMRAGRGLSIPIDAERHARVIDAAFKRHRFVSPDERTPRVVPAATPAERTIVLKRGGALTSSSPSSLPTPWT
ncbi:MAG: hypothetical protein U1F67_07080 [Rubrivivax sp.]